MNPLMQEAIFEGKQTCLLFGLVSTLTNKPQ
jgi:hypothetical protein